MKLMQSEKLLGLMHSISNTQNFDIMEFKEYKIDYNIQDEMHYLNKKVLEIYVIESIGFEISLIWVVFWLKGRLPDCPENDASF